MQIGHVYLKHIYSQCRNDLHFYNCLWVVNDAAVLHHVENIELTESFLFKKFLCDRTNHRLLDPLDSIPLLHVMILLAVLQFSE